MKLEIIEWIDSMGVNPLWTHISDMENHVCKCKSVGYIVQETNEFIVIAPNIADAENDPQVCGHMVIPKCAILKRDVQSVIQNI